MKKIKLKIFIGIVAFLIGVGTTASFIYLSMPEKANQLKEQAIKTRLPENSDQDAVYAAVLNELIIKDKIKKLMISDQTGFIRNLEYSDDASVEILIQNMRKSYEGAEDETLKDFDVKNRQPAKLNFNFELPVQYRLINKGELSKGPGSETDNISKNLRAGGLIEFSGVGFNQNKTQALIHIKYAYCPLCGFGRSMLLENINGHWEIIKNYEGWKS